MRTSPLKWCGDRRECLWCNPPDFQDTIIEHPRFPRDYGRTGTVRASRKIRGIPTQVCALPRNDEELFSAHFFKFQFFTLLFQAGRKNIGKSICFAADSMKTGSIRFLGSGAGAFSGALEGPQAV